MDRSAEPDLLQEIHSVEAKLSELEQDGLFSGSWDHCKAVVIISAPSEAICSEWAYELTRRFLGLTFRSLLPNGQETGYFVEGKCAFGRLKSLAGIHEVAHLIIPSRDMSIAAADLLVTVFPLIPDLEDVHLEDKNLTWDRYRKVGHSCFGSRNEAARVRHLPTGIVAESHLHRNLHENEALALQMLRSRLAYDGHICLPDPVHNQPK